LLIASDRRIRVPVGFLRGLRQSTRPSWAADACFHFLGFNFGSEGTIMMRQFTLAALASGVGFVAPAGNSQSRAAEQVDATLTDTSQIRTAANNPFFGAGTTENVAGVNFFYPAGGVAAGATVNGVGFDNIDMSGTNPASGPFTLTQNRPGVTLTQNMPWGGVDNGERNQDAMLTGPDAATANAVAAEMFYVGFVGCCHESASLTFAGLDPNQNLYVQVIGGDQGWNGDLNVTANGTLVGEWETVADGATDAFGIGLNASIYGFDTAADAGGSVTLSFAIADGNFGAISGVVISGQVVPEPAALGLLGLGGLALLPRRRAR
jgi:MYXO-CTERM domain-containing protein